MRAGPTHLLLAPIVVPLLAAAAMLLLGERRRRLASMVNVAATGAVLVAACEILRRVDADGVPGTIGVYLASNWEAPFGIVLVADRLSALMLVLAGVVSLATAVYAAAGWSRAGVYFHPLFQIQILGLNGAFLTGDLFNLFVFFEVALTASYGLLLHGSGWARVRSGLHYIAVNLLASSLFLIGLALIYGVMGTLSMADVAVKVPSLPASDRPLLHAGVAILAVAFLTKAAVWPLNSWLAPAYLAASAPVGALFALMTKLGVYAILRTSTLVFSADAGPSAHFGEPVLLYGGLATGVLGMLGVMGSLRLGRIAAFTVIVSSGTLLAAIGTGVPSVTSTALFYLLTATLGASLFFLLVELIERGGVGPHRPGPREADLEPGEDTNLDDEEEALVGRVFPASQAVLGLAFVACALLVAGLPPLSTFAAKMTLLASLSSAIGLELSSAPGAAIWGVFALVLGSGLVATVSLTRTGIRSFWAPSAGSPPQLRLAEGVPVVALILAGAWLAVRAEPVLRYTNATAEALYAPTAYIDAVMSTRPVPGPAQPITPGTTR